MCLYVCVSVCGHDMYVCACVSECVRVCVCIYLATICTVCVYIWAWLPYVEEGFLKRRGLGPVSPPLYLSRVRCSESWVFLCMCVCVSVWLRHLLCVCVCVATIRKRGVT